VSGAGLLAAGLLCLSVAVGCAKEDASPPGDFGVNVVVDARGLAETVRTRIARGSLTAEAPGAAPVVRPVTIASEAIKSGELRFRYIPARTTGTLALAFEALDAAGAVVASGRTSSPLTLTAGRAVTGLLTLMAGGGDGGVDAPSDHPSLKGNGEACSAKEECGSGFCVEGVCCNSACSGLCESCVAGQRGRCDPAPDGTDPKLQCGPATPPDAGVSPDADPTDATGADRGIEPPDGGFQGSNQTCAGKCNGARACRYPGTEKSCGNRWCNTASEVAAMTCDGQGACGPTLSACTDYACVDGACKTRCAAHEDCQAGTTYCNAGNMCALKKADGLGCVTGDECRSGHCAGGGSGSGVCCNSACENPFTCTETPGRCKCPGVTCVAGIACQVFYKDADGDTFGDKFGTLNNGGAQAACANTPPPGFVASATDCDDGDASAKPGQTAFFDVASRGKGTYDYDCDGRIVKGLPENLGSTCKFCTGGEDLFSCGKPTATCASKGQTAGLTCSVKCNSDGRFFLCFCQPSDGFVAVADCGVPSEFKVCGTCAEIGQAPSSPYSYNRKQTCH
jgi:hypothetical protein